IYILSRVEMSGGGRENSSLRESPPRHGSTGKNSFRNARVVFEELDGEGRPTGTHRTGHSGSIDRFHIADIRPAEQAVLRVVQDGSFVPAAAGFVLVGLGLALTFVQKLGETRP
ncbi:MAG: hypothetical protein ACOC8N_07845, partial [Spirochaetota bacterium]